jgi:hypothetical protein
MHGAGFVSLFGNLAANVAYLSLRTSPSSDFFYFASTPAAAASSVNQISWQMYTNTTYVNGGGFYIAA